MKLRRIATATVVAVVATGVTLVAGACKARQEPGVSRTNDLMPGKKAQEGKEKDILDAMKKGPSGTNRKVVIIYYANDTYAPRRDDPAQQNLDSLVNLLNTKAKEEEQGPAQARLANLSKKLITDWDSFRDVALRDTNALKQRFCEGVSQSLYPSVAGLAVFRNNMNDSTMYTSEMDGSPDVRRLVWSTCTPGTSMTEKYLEIPRSSLANFPYLSQPFSHPYVLKKALESVREVFKPAGDYRFVLITKSHGSAEMAITPHLSVDLRSDTADQAKAQLIVDAIKAGGKETQDAIGLNEMKVGNPILAEVDSALVSSHPIDQPPGISKSYYVDLLLSLGNGDPKTAMNFPIVLLESCKSDLRASQELQVYLGESEGYEGIHASNVGLIFASDMRGLPYDKINYSELNTLPEIKYAKGDLDAGDMMWKFLASKAAKAPPANP